MENQQKTKDAKTVTATFQGVEFQISKEKAEQIKNLQRIIKENRVREGREL